MSKAQVGISLTKQIISSHKVFPVMRRSSKTDDVGVTLASNGTAKQQQAADEEEEEEIADEVGGQGSTKC